MPCGIEKRDLERAELKIFLWIIVSSWGRQPSIQTSEMGKKQTWDCLCISKHIIILISKLYNKSCCTTQSQSYSRYSCLNSSLGMHGQSALPCVQVNCTKQNYSRYSFLNSSLMMQGRSVLTWVQVTLCKVIRGKTVRIYYWGCRVEVPCRGCKLHYTKLFEVQLFEQLIEDARSKCPTVGASPQPQKVIYYNDVPIITLPVSNMIKIYFDEFFQNIDIE